MTTTDRAKANPQKIRVLIANLGSPDEPTPTAVRRFLKQFLSDPRVVQVNRLLWWFVLNVIILNIRPKRVAEAYQSVWTDEGSPLISISKKQVAAEKILVLPMYPQFSYTTTAAVSDGIKSALEKMNFNPELITVHDYPAYINAIANSIIEQHLSA